MLGSPGRIASTNDVAGRSRICHRLDQGARQPERCVGKYPAGSYLVNVGLIRQKFD
jgi:hypothetical protein